MFREDEHPRESDGKFTDKSGDHVATYGSRSDFTEQTKGIRFFRQNASYESIIGNESADSYSLPDEIIPRSLSAKWRNYEIAMPDGTVAHFAEGSKLQDIQVFAGKGTKKPIRDVERLVRMYGGKEEDWMKVKGFGTIVMENGEEELVELHWYQGTDPEKRGIKAKIK